MTIMKKNKLIASIAVFSLLALVALPAIAATTADVSATVTAQLVAVSVSNGNVAYGVLDVNTNANTVDLSQTQVVTNDGNVDVNLEVKSSDAIGGIDWNLAATNAALDEFTHEFSSNGGGAWTAFSVVNATYTSLAGPVTTTQNLDLRIKTPTSVSDNVQKTITITVLATEA